MAGSRVVHTVKGTQWHRENFLAGKIPSEGWCRHDF